MGRTERLAEGGWFVMQERWLSDVEERALFAELKDSVVWQQKKVMLFGGEFLQPRLSAWYGDPGTEYTYSGLTLAPAPWSASLLALRARVQAECAQIELGRGVHAAVPAFNSVLLNYYRDGDDSTGFHSDEEKELGENPVIASVSLGARRRFIMKPKGTVKEGTSIELELGEGSLFVMGGTMQHRYRHGLPKQRGAGPRINLTFRHIYTDVA